MTLKKIGDLPNNPYYKPPCHHPEHNPPTMIVLEPGRYEHICPGCGKKIEFTVNKAVWL